MHIVMHCKLSIHTSSVGCRATKPNQIHYSNANGAKQWKIWHVSTFSIKTAFSSPSPWPPGAQELHQHSPVVAGVVVLVFAALLIHVYIFLVYSNISQCDQLTLFVFASIIHLGTPAGSLRGHLIVHQMLSPSDRIQLPAGSDDLPVVLVWNAAASAPRQP